MIRLPGWNGAAFSEGSDGDLRNDDEARSRFSAALGLAGEWAVIHQVHGHEVIRVDAAGVAGHADALWTTEPGLPLAVFTADCFGVVLGSPGAVGVAHAGWRGVRSGVVGALREEMAMNGHQPINAVVGPGIRSCCFEVGPEVAEGFPQHQAMTTWGTTSVDLPAGISAQLAGSVVWSVDFCTFHDVGWFSHRRERTPKRLASVGWVP